MSVIGIDIGGANLKVARDDGTAWTEPFALWQQPHVLASQLMEQWFTATPDVVLATMTGELCDCFETRAEGVTFIIEQLEAASERADVRLWSMRDGFVSPAEARDAPYHVASGNWHALASWLAPMWTSGATLLLDIGSTTSDVVLLRDGLVGSESNSDFERLRTGELVYLGADRTPIMALTRQLHINDQPTPVMAEHFATLGDALLLTGDVDESPAASDTPDSRPRSKDAAARRMLRMVGSDLDHHDQAAACELATQCRAVAIERLRSAIMQVADGAAPDRVVLSGSGACLARDAVAAADVSAPSIALAERVGHAASNAACAHALVKLWQRAVT